MEAVTDTNSKKAAAKAADKAKKRKERPVKTLVVTSHGTPAGAALPVLAALEVAGHRVRAMDIGRVGARYKGTVERVMKAISAEFAERRLARELSSESPDVAMAFDPGSISALTELRRHSSSPVVVIAVIAELEPDPAWAQVKADRYLTIDAEAAVTLADGGVAGERIMTVGPITGYEFAQAGKQRREVLRARFKLPLSEPVVLAQVAGLGPELTSQLALQLSLIDAPVTYLFAAGADTDSANALRKQAPTLSLRAKLFGKTDDEPLLWRASDVVLAMPTDEVAQRALAINTKMIALLPEDDEGRRVVSGIEDRGMGTAVANALMVSGALEPLISSKHQPSARTGADGAANVADIATVVGRQKGDVTSEGVASRVSSSTSASSAPPRTAPPGELEDLSFGIEDLFAGEPDEKTKKVAALRAKMDQLAKAITLAQEAADQWEGKKAVAARGKDHDRAKAAGKNADAERAKMHRALKELSKLEGELRKVEGRNKPSRSSSSRSSSSRSAGRGPSRRSSPNFDAVLNDMKKQSAATVDDELAALKKKMTGKRGKS